MRIHVTRQKRIEWGPFGVRLREPRYIQTDAPRHRSRRAPKLPPLTAFCHFVIWIVVAGAVVAPSTANAYPYEAYIAVDSLEELEDLLAAEQISEETYLVLADLLERGVDLNKATRDQLYSLPNLTYDDVDAMIGYRTEQGVISNPEDLVAAGAISADKLIGIAAFLVTVERTHAPYRGWVRGQTRYAIADWGVLPHKMRARMPPLALRARVQYRRSTTAGIAATMGRLALTDVAYDPNRQGLLVNTHELGVHLPKLYVKYEDEKKALIVGSYRVGFGQRLTFDNSSDYSPNGLYLDDGLYASSYLTSACRSTAGELPETICDASDQGYVTPDYTWSRSLRGVAAGIKHAPVGGGYLQAYAWGSYQANNAYFSEIYDRARCEDPRNDDDPNCGSLGIYVRPEGPDRLAPTNRQTFVTLPGLFNETVLGGNVTYFAAPRRYVGVTAYGAQSVDSLDGVDIGYQEWASRPSHGWYGAAGVSAGYGRGPLDVVAEVTRSFDQMEPTIGPADGGGGYGFIMRGTHSVKERELELSVRYYDVNFANPFGSPIAAADEFEGHRARDEMGARARYNITTKRYGLRAVADVWRSAVDDANRGSLSLHGDYTVNRRTKVGAWLDWTDKDLAKGGTGVCYETEFEIDQFGEQLGCTGQRFLYALRATLAPSRSLAISLHGQHALLDDPNYADSKRHDVSATAIARLRLAARERLVVRLRYLNKAIQDRDYLEESLNTAVEFTQSLRPRQHLKLRVDYVHWLDDRASTAERTPNPELRLWLTYQHAI